MAAEIISIDPDTPDAAAVAKAAKVLEEGGLVAIPTETVYGLAANASIAASVERLREIKGRETSQPFTVHIGEAAAAESYVPDISTLGRRFMRKGWPGPLTLVFKVEDASTAPMREKLSEPGFEAIYTKGSVGLRYPDMRAAELLLRQANAPIIASSANRTGSAAPTEAGPIADALGDQIDLIVDAGPSRYRKGSTIVEVNGAGYQLIREGVWDERTIRRLSTVNILFVCTGNTCRSPIAEGICRKLLAEKLGCAPDELAGLGVNVMSAGTGAYSGGRASEDSVTVCQSRGIDIAMHRSQALTPELVHAADYIFVMARQHLDAIRAISPRDLSKAMLLGVDGDIADPVGGPKAEYERAAVEIENALNQRLSEVSV